MGLSYAKAWTHIKILRTLQHDKLVMTQKAATARDGVC